MRPDPDPTADWYGRAARELAPHSAVHSARAAAVAEEPDLLDRIDELPRQHRQPSLVLCAAAFAGLPEPAGTGSFVRWTLEHWDDVSSVAAARTTQTNEPGRCLPLAVALGRVGGPVALVELGASAGLCLLPDRYSLRFSGPDPVRIGTGSPRLEAQVSGSGPLPDALPGIAWRCGIDLAPLDVRVPGDVRWLEALVPPDRPDRLERLREAIATARADPPPIVRGDALSGLDAVLAEIPSGLTAVVVSLGTAVYLSPDDRARLLPELAARDVRAITFEAETALPRVAAALIGLRSLEPHPFVLALDGEPIARCSPHGDRVSFLGAAPSAA